MERRRQIARSNSSSNRKPIAARYSRFFLVLGERERSFAAARELCGRQARDEERHGAGVVFERRAVMKAELLFFAAHDDGIEQGEIAEQEEPLEIHE